MDEKYPTMTIAMHPKLQAAYRKMHPEKSVKLELPSDLDKITEGMRDMSVDSDKQLGKQSAFSDRNKMENIKIKSKAKNKVDGAVTKSKDINSRNPEPRKDADQELGAIKDGNSTRLPALQSKSSDQSPAKEFEIKSYRKDNGNGDEGQPESIVAEHGMVRKDQEQALHQCTLLENLQSATTPDNEFPAKFNYNHRAEWVQEYISLMKKLVDNLEKIDYKLGLNANKHPDGVHVYNPLRFASTGHDAFLSLMPNHRPKYLFVGINPGPHGSQSGIPFGNKQLVKDYLKIEVNTTLEFPNKGEGSDRAGRSFWEWVKNEIGSRDFFLDKYFVYNYCPLLFLHGKEYLYVKLQEITGDPSKNLKKYCNEALKDLIELLGRPRVILLGSYVHRCGTNTMLEKMDFAQEDYKLVHHPKRIKTEMKKRQDETKGRSKDDPHRRKTDQSDAHSDSDESDQENDEKNDNVPKDKSYQSLLEWIHPLDKNPQ